MQTQIIVEGTKLPTHRHKIYHTLVEEEFKGLPVHTNGVFVERTMLQMAITHGHGQVDTGRTSAEKTKTKQTNKQKQAKGNKSQLQEKKYRCDFPCRQKSLSYTRYQKYNSYRERQSLQRQTLNDGIWHEHCMFVFAGVCVCWCLCLLVFVCYVFVCLIVFV